MRLSKIRDITLTLVIIIGLALLINWLNSGNGKKDFQSAQLITGKARIIDADSFFIGNDEIRLFGIDAPEGKQFCKSGDNKNYPCGRHAAQALQKHIKDKSIKCKIRTWDRYNRAVSICYIGQEDLNDWIVRQGHATAYRKYSHQYIAAEKDAQNNGRGIWQGSFLPPSHWRQINNPQ